MSKKTSKFLKLVEEHQEGTKEQKFQGTLADYIALVEKDKSLTKLAHKRLFDSIVKYGVERMTDSDARCNKLFGGERIRTYNYFQSHFFGMERSLAKIMRYLSSASMKGEESRQVLLLLGPVGAGKSALMGKNKRSFRTREYVPHRRLSYTRRSTSCSAADFARRICKYIRS